MDTWEFFQDAKSLWRWRCTHDGGQRVFNSTRSYPSRAEAVADAKTHGYAESDDETFVNLRALREPE